MAPGRHTLREWHQPSAAVYADVAVGVDVMLRLNVDGTLRSILYRDARFLAPSGRVCIRPAEDGTEVERTPTSDARVRVWCDAQGRVTSAEVVLADPGPSRSERSG